MPFDLYSNLTKHVGKVLRMPRVSFHWPSIFEGRIAFGIAGLPGEFFKKVDGQVQIEIVHIARDEVQLSRKLWPQRLPIILSIVPQVIAIVAHVKRNFAVYLTGSLVPQRARITITAHWTVDRFPGIELITRAAFASEHS